MFSGLAKLFSAVENLAKVNGLTRPLVEVNEAEAKVNGLLKTLAEVIVALRDGFLELGSSSSNEL